MKKTIILTSLIAMAGLVNAATITWEGGAGNWADSTWDVDGTANQLHSAYNTDAIDTIISSGTVTAVATEIDHGGNDTLTIDGGAALVGNYIRVYSANSVTLGSGSISLSNANSFRTNGVAFNGQYNFTGAAGGFLITQTNNTGTNGNTLAGKATSLSAGLFAIDGVKITSLVSYDGSNLAALNTSFATQAIGGRALFLTESGGSQSLSLVTVAVPEPSSTALLGLGGLALILRRRK